ncbi:MAG: UDP-2,4-diacetamido-2,4,6-trideoxy-beta-L-altropyranose hydrolase [Bacteroides sp.]|nr:UDP-2,4-diacetamido-2,4,6-trideoxy-beta-L-altropyranose hydrolase [Bacteroides sp.]MCM1084920.1 UDP-2,4-diacetamido-2,4,6-trideoxy-beta-L-altropyranose hydrolase [Bacteroides sp.]MCM1169811.1 UDP-2,4-diacetamido-2,4,6-trideoxy-beta-L-altropyranose hydrolase [Bacteroides sp.]
MERSKVYFRADADTTIGYGHFIRTLALADMLKEDFDCVFFTQTPTEYQIHEASEVCRLESLPADETRFDLFLERLRGDEIVVLDNYFYTTEYQQAIKAKGCRLVCIDDMHDRHYVADVVVNHGIDKASLLDVEPYTRLCLGLEWALLRRPFLEAAKRGPSHRNDRMEKVAVCFGGSDAMDFTGRFAVRLTQIPSVREIIAVTGDGYRPKEPMEQDSRVHYRSRLSAEEMAEVFTQADAVFCSASSVCMEALACGAKVAAGWYVDNQRGFYEMMKAHGWIYPLEKLPGEYSENLPELTDFVFGMATGLFSGIGMHYVSLFKTL